MNRRDFINTAAYGVIAISSSSLSAKQPPPKSTITPPSPEYLRRMRRPNKRYEDDVIIPDDQRTLLSATRNRLARVYKLVGYRNFNIISFEEMLKLGRSHTAIGSFEVAEIQLLEQLFHTDAKEYGFIGEKPVTALNARIKRKEVKSIRGTGHFLFRGPSLNTYKQITAAIGDSITLTSGARGIVKQMYLFTSKADRFDGNLSLASRSIAPPGYSFHGTGDFDVGKKGFGRKNFTNAFAKTEEYKQLVRLGYVELRYPKGNGLGVRFEPWHIKVSPRST